MKTHRVQIITALSQVPACFVAGTSFLPDRRSVLSAAALNGEIQSAKLMRTPFDVRGPVFYCLTEATEYLNEYYGIPAGSSHQTAELPAPGAVIPEERPTAEELPGRSGPQNEAENMLQELPAALASIKPEELTYSQLDRAGHATGALIRGLTTVRRLAALTVAGTDLVAQLDDGIRQAKLKMIDLACEAGLRDRPIKDEADRAEFDKAKADATADVLAACSARELVGIAAARLSRN